VPASGNSGRFQYTGQIFLPDLGLYYYKARIYNPKLGRFMQTDPVGYKDDYVHAKSKGGDGATPKDMRNHETKCWQCNHEKRDQ
jgi:RHS repeat-associated protein